MKNRNGPGYLSLLFLAFCRLSIWLAGSFWYGSGRSNTEGDLSSSTPGTSGDRPTIDSLPT